MDSERRTRTTGPLVGLLVLTQAVAWFVPVLAFVTYQAPADFSFAPLPTNHVVTFLLWAPVHFVLRTLRRTERISGDWSELPLAMLSFMISAIPAIATLSMQDSYLPEIPIAFPGVVGAWLLFLLPPWGIVIVKRVLGGAERSSSRPGGASS